MSRMGQEDAQPFVAPIYHPNPAVPQKYPVVTPQPERRAPTLTPVEPVKTPVPEKVE